MKFVPIVNKSENEVAEILKSSALFLSFAYQEGFSLPPLEAIMCGCSVIGYHGQAAKEYLHPPYATPIEAGDFLSYAREIEKFVLLFESQKDTLLKQSRSIP